MDTNTITQAVQSVAQGDMQTILLVIGYGLFAVSEVVALLPVEGNGIIDTLKKIAINLLKIKGK